MNKKCNESNMYGIGEVVWAKIRGYPYWPAIVITKKHNNYSGFKSL